MKSPSPIRIVPVRLEAIAPAAAPRLTYRGGPLLTSAQVFLLFWGDAWRQNPQSGLMQELNDFFDFVVASPVIDQLDEYSVPRYPIGHGTRTGSVVVAGSPPARLDDSEVRQLVQHEIASDPVVAQPTPSSLYFVFLPPGVSAGMDGGKSCVNFCGYHDAIDGALFYAVMPYPDCDGCMGGSAVLDALTSTSSHELCEAVTDPVPGQGWYDDANGEIGDICAWQTRRLGKYAVQLEWSNQQGKCV
ncbi:MAG TPA: hypothetical protein VJQ08_08265 [Candidatus Dormibacteraeota bacterium]|nr:hypothetical protein [Candidatus Dormibacteraeota bacterium]